MTTHISSKKNHLQRETCKKITGQVGHINLLDNEVFHEICNHLTVISSNAQFCLKHYANHEDARRSLMSIIDNVGFINKFLKHQDISKIKIQPGIVQINDVIRKAIVLLETDINHKDMRLSINLGHIPESRVDAVKLEEVFVNLLLNSVNSLKNGGAINISSSFDRDTNDIIIRLEDDGKGVPQRYIEKVFEPFFSLSNGGKGIGLAICRKIIESHNGNIFAENITINKKKWMRVSIQIPLQVD